MGHHSSGDITNGISDQICPFKAHQVLQYSPQCHVKFKLPAHSHLDEMKCLVCVSVHLFVKVMRYNNATNIFVV